MGEVIAFQRSDAAPMRPGSTEPATGAAPRAYEPRSYEPLWREVLGGTLRAAREERGDRLIDVAGRAGISPQYLSEIERGRKEPSSEMIAAISGALGHTLRSTLDRVSRDLHAVSQYNSVLLAA